MNCVYCDTCDNLMFPDAVGTELAYACRTCQTRIPAPPGRTTVFRDVPITSELRMALRVNAHTRHDNTLPIAHGVACAGCGRAGEVRCIVVNDEAMQAALVCGGCGHKGMARE